MEFYLPVILAIVDELCQDIPVLNKHRQLGSVPGRQEVREIAESTYVRTQVRTKNPAKGVYRTLGGSYEIRQAERKGCWDVYRLLDGGAQKIASEVRGYDAALNRVLEEPGVELEALNAPPAKAKAEPQQAATPAVEVQPKGRSAARSRPPPDQRT